MCLQVGRGETLRPAEYFRHPFHSIIDAEPNTPTQPSLEAECLNCDSPAQGGL